jgi:Transposase, Mutator family
MPIVAQTVSVDKGSAQVDQMHLRRQELRDEINELIGPSIAHVFNEALADQVTTLLGRRKGQHRAKATPQPTSLRCPSCGRRQALDFVRKGRYARTQLTLWGNLDLAVPRVECTCGHCPSIAFDVLNAYDRVWSDIDTVSMGLVAWSVSLRTIGAVVQLQSGQVISIGTTQRRVKRVAALAAVQMRQKLTHSPAVIVLDGLWGSVMVETGETKKDKRGRLRRVKRGKKIPLLVALGVDPVTGETTLLAWRQGTAEGVDDWTALLTTLYERGIHADSGLRLFIHDGCAGLESALEMVDFGAVRRQRCVFHKLRNVARDVLGHEGMTRAEKRARLLAVLEEATAIYDAPSAAEARERAAAFRLHWHEQEPKAVATLERDFEMTVTYYALLDEAQATGCAWRPQCLRTTSLLEGENGSLRAKWRQARSFWSVEGQTGALWLVARQRERSDKKDRTAWLSPIIDGVLAARQPQPNFPIP